MLDIILTGLMDAGCSQKEIDIAERLYVTGQDIALINHLKICRCKLMDQLHVCQKKVDCLDFVIRKTEKEI